MRTDTVILVGSHDTASAVAAVLQEILGLSEQRHPEPAGVDRCAV